MQNNNTFKIDSLSIRSKLENLKKSKTFTTTVIEYKNMKKPKSMVNEERHKKIASVNKPISSPKNISVVKNNHNVFYNSIGSMKKDKVDEKENIVNFYDTKEILEKDIQNICIDPFSIVDYNFAMNIIKGSPLNNYNIVSKKHQTNKETSEFNSKTEKIENETKTTISISQKDKNRKLFRQVTNNKNLILIGNSVMKDKHKSEINNYKHIARNIYGTNTPIFKPNTASNRNPLLDVKAKTDTYKRPFSKCEENSMKRLNSKMNYNIQSSTSRSKRSIIYGSNKFKDNSEINAFGDDKIFSKNNANCTDEAFKHVSYNVKSIVNSLYNDNYKTRNISQLNNTISSSSSKSITKLDCTRADKTIDLNKNSELQKIEGNYMIKSNNSSKPERNTYTSYDKKKAVNYIKNGNPETEKSYFEIDKNKYFDNMNNNFDTSNHNIFCEYQNSVVAKDANAKKLLIRNWNFSSNIKRKSFSQSNAEGLGRSYILKNNSLLNIEESHKTQEPKLSQTQNIDLEISIINVTNPPKINDNNTSKINDNNKSKINDNNISKINDNDTTIINETLPPINNDTKTKDNDYVKNDDKSPTASIKTIKVDEIVCESQILTNTEPKLEGDQVECSILDKSVDIKICKSKADDNKFKSKVYIEISSQFALKLKPAITSKCWVIYDFTQDRVLYGEKFCCEREVASLTKLMTLLVACKYIKKYRISPNSFRFTVSKEAGSKIGTTARLKPGDSVKIMDLLYGMMLPSGNDAAQTIAEGFGEKIKSYKDHKQANKYNNKSNVNPLYVISSMQGIRRDKPFLDSMNKIARKLELSNTNYQNVHGLINNLNKSSALDVAKVMTHGIKNYPLYNRIIGQTFWRSSTIIRDKQEISLEWKNSHKMITTSYSCKGGKTGITQKAGPCLATYMESHNAKLIIIQLKCSTMTKRFQETQSQWNWSQDKYNLLTKMPQSEIQNNKY